MGSKLDALKALAEKATGGKLTTYHAFMDSCSPDTLLALIASCEELATALFSARSALDFLMGDSDIEDDGSIEFKACQGASAALTRYAERWGKP